MNRNVLLLKNKKKITGDIIIKTSGEVDKNKFNPDVKSNYMKDKRLRIQKVVIKKTKIPETKKIDKLKEEEGKVILKPEEVEKTREEVENEIKSIINNKPKRNIISIDTKKIDNDIEKKENTEEFYNEEKKRLDDEKRIVEEILNEYK